MASPNGATVTNLTDTITDNSNQIWKFSGGENGKGWPVVRDGVAMGTRGKKILWYNNVINVMNKSGLWVMWGGTKWINIPGDPSAGEPTEPVNCVLGDWRLAEAGPYSSCQPDGFKHRSETWVKDIITPPENGGQDCGVRVEQRIGELACQYVPPPAGVITYFVTIGIKPNGDSEHTHSFTDVGEMKIWIPNYHPIAAEPVACRIDWRDYAGQAQYHETATFNPEFLAYIDAFEAEDPPDTPGTELPFPGQPHWRDIWPNYNPLDLSQAPSGLFNGKGYPERRAFVEGQWWFSTVGDIDKSRHLHVGACVPAEAKGIFDINVVITTSHWEAFNGVPLGVFVQGLYSAHMNTPGVSVMLPAPKSESQPGTVNVPITEHIQYIHIPMRINSLGATTDGWKALVLRVDMFRPIEQIHHLITLRVPVYLNNGNRPITEGNDSGTFMASGWMTEHVVDPVTGRKVEINNFNYIEPTIPAWNPSNTADNDWRNRRFVDDKATSWACRGSGGTGSWPLDLFVTKNPDFHAHPPVNGIVKVPETAIGSSKTTFTVPCQDFLVDDRMVLRISDRKPLRYGWVADANGIRMPKRLAPGQTVPVQDQIQLHDGDNTVAATVLVTRLGPAKS